MQFYSRGMVRIFWRTGVRRAFSLPLRQSYIQALVLWSLWRRRSIILHLPRLFWEPGMVLVKDCEVTTSPFISVVSSSWQLPSWWVFSDKPWRAPRLMLWPSITSFGAAGSSKFSGHQGLFLSLDAPTHPWRSDLPQCNWVTQSNGNDAVEVFPRGLALFYVFARLPKWKTTKPK